MHSTLPEHELERRVVILEKTGGIQPPHIAFYAGAIYAPALSCIADFERFDRLMASREDNSLIFSALHAALIQAAAVSRFFWPAATKGKNATTRKLSARLAAARATQLRRLFAIGDDSALADRNFRNAIEHFDERLDWFLLHVLAGNFYPLPAVGPIPGGVDHVFKNIDPSNCEVTILGQTFSYERIRQETSEIWHTANNLLG